jgi:hypothetical protein
MMELAKKSAKATTMTTFAGLAMTKQPMPAALPTNDFRTVLPLVNQPVRLAKKMYIPSIRMSGK